MYYKRALIIGISGQDGAYLAKFLLAKGYEVHGTSRDAEASQFNNLNRLGIRDSVFCHSMSLQDFRSILQCLRNVNPAEVYNLAGQSSVGLSFQHPVETYESIAVANINILEAIRFLKMDTKYYNACSGECFGGTDENNPANEKVPFNPQSPYAVAKSAAYWAVDNYRKAYQMFACSGILFNHESPLRPQRYVTMKIISTALRIAKGSNEKLVLGDLTVRRDWGWAPEYIEPMWLMLQQTYPEDYVIATGSLSSVEDFVHIAFDNVGLNWREHVQISDNFMRPLDIKVSWGNPQKAKEMLGWEATVKGKDLIRRIIEGIYD